MAPTRCALAAATRPPPLHSCPWQPAGDCKTGFTVNRDCDAGAGTKPLVEKMCLGKQQCVLAADSGMFSDPCYGQGKSLAVMMVCN